MDNKNNKRINVLFVCAEIAKWKCQNLYDLMLADENFEPKIVVTIPFCKDFREKEYLDNCRFFEEKNIPYLQGYKPETNEFISFKTFNPDVIFHQQPYALHENQTPLHCANKALSCYVPYFLPNQVSRLEYGYDFHSDVDKFYILDKNVKEYYSKMMKNQGKNLVVVGHPYLDYFQQKKMKKEKKYVIYAPHHSICDERTNFSTFLWSGKLILEYAKKHPEINWIFKPHPYLRVTLKNYFTADEIKNYWNEWSKISKVVETPDYLDLFEQSYALITDCGSFLTEYFLTKQPVIHLRREDSVPYNKTVTNITDTYYKAYNADELNELLEEVIIKRHDYKADERINLLKTLDFCNKNASLNIIKDLKKELNLNDKS